MWNSAIWDFLDVEPSYANFWFQVVGSDQKDMVASTADTNEVHLQVGLTLKIA